VATAGCSGRASARIVGERPRQQAQRGQVLRQAFRPQVQHQRGLQRGQRQLAHAQRALHRELADAVHRRAAADDQPGLRAAQQLVAAEGDDVAAGGELLLRQRLARQAVGAPGRPASRAQVGGQRQAAGVRDAAPGRLRRRRR
jgi:hypothetical protein